MEIKAVSTRKKVRWGTLAWTMPVGYILGSIFAGLFTSGENVGLTVVILLGAWAGVYALAVRRPKVRKSGRPGRAPTATLIRAQDERQGPTP